MIELTTFKKTFWLVFLIILLMPVHSIELKIYAKIDSIRKGNIVTLLFYEKPYKDVYYIIESNNIIGEIRIHAIEKHILNSKITYKAIAEYNLERRTYERTIKAGMDIGLVEGKKIIKAQARERNNRIQDVYKKQIITPRDQRIMILIPEGKFVFGNNNDEDDEYPEQIIYLDNFYIDKYEVSNRDYLKYITSTGSKPPISWYNGKYKEGEEDLPVLVSYFEATAYTEWAGKRLPTEKEWEKSARGEGIKVVKGKEDNYTYIKEPIIYPWGNIYDPEKANSLDFWRNKGVGLNIKKKFKQGLLPVNLFSDTGGSPYGVINLSGNAAEWTSSWYKAYSGSRFTDKRYGEQVKVIRGGAWYSDKKRLRVTSREIGGIPNLYEDPIAGFRCVRKPKVLDRIP
ncbi:MAG: SUMF1/EgtB/PvdO family nonheme iron enzyme [Spirochaetota bacterium]|nr:SUMF1/EgtB/PvdO family nonheme iron enzyme [Spirochaetota bacterium]